MNPASTKLTRSLDPLSRRALLFLRWLAIAGGNRTARACTGITLKANDGTVVFGRTLEWGPFDLGSRLVDFGEVDFTGNKLIRQPLDKQPREDIEDVTPGKPS